ncbi:uncharacterized protein LOC6643709 [Drosophila willistoni]|uniref:uncharacterized protein LOC6643709 n=1 Tax=Drosophila willistoni TaxID=7260 RepID=UPI000C26CF7B|nr:uncharacterized protein LOC6643709 [Drosophila willistoni]
MSVAKTLAEAGHNVTVVSMLEPKVKCKDIHLIVIPVSDEQELLIENKLKQIAMKKNTLYDTFYHLMNDMKVMIDTQYELLSHPKFQQIYETKFDLMILGWFVNDFQLGVAAKLKVPVIVDWVMGPTPGTDALVGNPAEISYVPNMMNPVSKGKIMSFGKRLNNLATHWFYKYLNGLFDKCFDEYYYEHFGMEKNLPTIKQLKQNVSLAFVNCHLISEGPIKPLVPATVQIGGIQIKDTPDPLPKDIEEFLSSSKHGAILLSLGSNIKSSSVKPELTKIIFKVLSSLKQNVIWKWEDLDNVPGNSTNVLYKKWLPQDDILAHPKLKLFITHAGKGSITEAQYHAVPMVALPVFADQPRNAAIMQNSGYGFSLDLLTLTEDTFEAALREVLENKKYAKAIGEFSTLYRDRPLTARQEVVYWTEYILRHRGAPHLQSPLVHMDTIAAYNLDIYVLLIVILAISLLITHFLLKYFVHKVFSKAVPSEGANILGLYSGYTPFHLILHMSVAKTLAEAGHNVTVVSMLEPKVRCKDIHLIVIPVSEEHQRIIENKLKEYATQENTIYNAFDNLLNGLKVMVDSQSELLSHPKFQQIYETKFDLMILGWFFNEFQLGVAAKLKVPVIVDSVMGPTASTFQLVGNPFEVSYVGNPLNVIQKDEDTSFGKRLKNYATHWVYAYLMRQFDKLYNGFYNDHFGMERDFPTFDQMKRNISLVFTSCHFISEERIRPLVPATIQIGGIQIKDTPHPLPKDIEEFLSSSKHGAILFSMGSSIKSSSLKPKVVQKIFNVLSKLKQNVIWKWEDLDKLPGNSPNIIYRKWLPQADIFAHTKTKLFITHAGKGGVTEAQYHGVPMVALPVFVDQPGNAAIMQSSGYGLSLDLLTLTKETFEAALREVLENKKYAKAIGEFSTLYRDRPRTARQEVVYWTEYILRHRGAPHLQSPLAHMAAIAAYNLDVYALLLVILAISLLITRFVVKFVLLEIYKRFALYSNISKKVK